MSNPLFRGNKGMPSMPNGGMPNGMQAMGNKMQQLRNVIGMIKGGGWRYCEYHYPVRCPCFPELCKRRRKRSCYFASQ